MPTPTWTSSALDRLRTANPYAVDAALATLVLFAASHEPVQVTGPAAQLVDFREMLSDRAPWAAATVLIGIFALLFAFTGSVLIPLRTIATTLLSVSDQLRET